MEHKILRMNNEQQEEVKETKIPKGQGVIFIKTRMSDNKIHDLVSEMKAVAEATDVEVVDVIVDEFASRDIDRDDVSRLSDWMETSNRKRVGASDNDAGMPYYSCIVTRKLEGGNTFITICAAPECARNGDYYE